MRAPSRRSQRSLLPVRGGRGTHAGLPRIASINLCTDQLLLTLADPDQIVGLSPYARDPAQSWRAAEARRSRACRAGPRMCWRQAGRRARRQLHQARDARIPEDAGAAGRRIRCRAIDRRDRRRRSAGMGEIAGHPDRAAREIARIDAAVARARASGGAPAVAVLDCRGAAGCRGATDLTSSLLASTGLFNAARDLTAVRRFQLWRVCLAGGDRQHPARCPAGVGAGRSRRGSRPAPSCCIPRWSISIRRRSAW